MKSASDLRWGVKNERVHFKAGIFVVISRQVTYAGRNDRYPTVLSIFDKTHAKSGSRDSEIAPTELTGWSRV